MSPADHIARHLARMEDWVEGRRSFMNLGPHAPYTPDVIARMDAAEVEKEASAVRAYASLVGLGLDLESGDSGGGT